jgi:hypothetical protein
MKDSINSFKTSNFYDWDLYRISVKQCSCKKWTFQKWQLTFFSSPRVKHYWLNSILSAWAYVVTLKYPPVLFYIKRHFSLLVDVFAKIVLDLFFISDYLASVFGNVACSQWLYSWQCSTNSKIDAIKISHLRESDVALKYCYSNYELQSSWVKSWPLSGTRLLYVSLEYLHSSLSR